MRAVGAVMSDSGQFVVANNDAYRLERGGDAVWRFYENNQWNFSVDSGGHSNTRINAYADNHFARSGLCAGNSWEFYIGPGGAGRLLQFAANWYWEWNINDGQTSWVGGGTRLWQMRQSPDNLVWNPTGVVGGFGAYQNFSDRRVKRNIEDTTYGLAEIMKLRPVTFNRIRFEKDARGPITELGFIAQEVRVIIPEAVTVIGSPMPDGTGGLDDDEPTLAMSIDPIVAALVNAVKELTKMNKDLVARVTHLESTTIH